MAVGVGEDGLREIRYVKESEIGERDAVSERDFLEDYDRIASENEWKDGYLGSMADLGGDGRGNNVVDRIVGYDADGFRTESGRVLAFDDVQGGRVRVFDPDNVSDLLGMTIVSPAEVSARNVAMDAKDAQRREEYNRRKEDAERLSEENNSAERTENGEKVSYNAEPKLDAQGNPVDESGKLIVERIESVNDLTDADFTAPTRSVEMPNVPQNVRNAIGAGEKPIVVKKNIFEKNAQNHPELTAEQSKAILNNALYNTDIVGQTQPVSRPNYWVAIKTDNPNSLVLLEVNNTKDNIEIVGWRLVGERQLEQLKRQTEREDGQLLILTSKKEAAAGLSTLPSDLSSDGKVTENNSNGKIDAGNSTAKELIERRAEQRREETEQQQQQQQQARATMSDEQRLVYDAVSDRLDKAGIKVELATEEEAKEVIDYFRGSDGRVLGWADKDGGIHLTQAGMNPETPIHEYSHLWGRAMRRNHPEVWSSIVELCKQNKMLWDDVAKDPNYAHLNGDESAITSEIMSRYIGREGAKRLEGVARRMYAEAQRNGTMKDSVSVGTYVSRVKQTVLNFWNKVAEMLGIRRFKNLREVERSVIGDLMNGRKFSADEVRSSANEHAFYGRRGAENLDAARGDRVNQENLSVAERMEQAGKNARAIKLATGWERGADGKWRMEMPDIKIKKDALNHINEYGVIDLRDLVEDDNLLSAYPEYSFAENYDPKTGEYEGMSMGIGDMSVEFANGLRNAYYDEEMHRIMIPSFYISVIGKGNENKLRDVLVHEIQHAIQEVEGFARGEDPSNGSFDAYRRSAGEVESRNVERRMYYSEKQRRESLASDTEDVQRDDQIARFGEGESQQAWMQGDFKTRQTEAVDNKGRVAPNLKEQSVNVVGAKAEHGFANFDEARSWAKENIVGTVKADENRSGVDITISNTAVNKFLSQSSVDKSASADVHLAVLKVLPDVIKESIDAEQHPDYNKGADGARAADNGYNQDVLVHRLYGAVEIDGKTYRVKTTVTEHISEKGQGRSHSYEATEIELLAGQHEAVVESTRVGAPTSRNSNSSISAAKLLENVEKSYDPGKKLLDESLSTSGSSVSASVVDPLGNARERVQRRRNNSSLDDFIAQELGMTAERMSQSLQELPQRVRDGMEDRLNGIGERLERIEALDATERELEREQTREAVEEQLNNNRAERERLVNEIRSLEEELDNTLLNRDLFYEDTKPEGLGSGEKSNDVAEQRDGMLGEDYEPFRATDFNGLTAEEAVWAGIRQNAERAGREGVEGLRRVAQTMRSAYEAVRKGMGIAEGNAKDMGTWLRALVALSDGEFSKGQVKRLLSAARKGTKAEQSEAMRSAVDVLSRHYVRACKERMLSLLDLGDKSSDGGMRVAGATVGREQVTLSSAKRYIVDDGLDRVERRDALNEELSRLGDSDADMSRREDIEAELAGLDLAEAYDRSARL